MSGVEALHAARRQTLAELAELAQGAEIRARSLVGALGDATAAGLDLAKAAEQARNAAARLGEALRLVERERDGAPAAPSERVILRVVEKVSHRA